MSNRTSNESAEDISMKPAPKAEANVSADSWMGETDLRDRGHCAVLVSVARMESRTSRVVRAPHELTGWMT